MPGNRIPPGQKPQAVTVQNPALLVKFHGEGGALVQVAVDKWQVPHFLAMHTASEAHSTQSGLPLLGMQPG